MTALLTENEKYDAGHIIDSQVLWCHDQKHKHQNSSHNMIHTEHENTLWSRQTNIQHEI